jgi:hypothetical protein
MTEAILLVILGLLTFVAIVIVLLDRFAEQVLAPDPEHED